MRFPRFIVFLIIASFFAGYLAWAPQALVKAQEIVPVIGDGVYEQPQENLGGIGLDAVGCTRINTTAMNVAYEQRVVELVNIERAKVGLPPLKRNSELDYAAREHARDMVADDYFAHDTFDRVNGALVQQCTTFERIKLYYSGYYLAGENLAAGYQTPEAVVQGWMGSDGHRANILRAEFREIGVGYYFGTATYGHYWGQDFGGKSDVYPLILNNEALSTTNPTVTFYAYGKGVWAEMRTRDNGGAWTNWQPFQETAAVQLVPTNGTHTLSVEMRAAGASTAGAASTDTIELTGQPVPDMPNKIFLPFVRR